MTNKQYDYIIIGAGSAGCVLASRLSEDKNNNVCLIEAGGSEQHPYIAIPAAVGAAIMSKRFGWGLQTTPQTSLNNRQVALPRGRVLGGSGSINGMAYYRGNALDYDDWEQEGNAGWGYADLLPYFLRSENNPEYKNSAYHNVGGPMKVSFVPRPNKLNESFNSAMAHQGFSPCEDFNIPEPEGYGYRQGIIDNGRRVSTASAYLRPIMHRSNLTVMTNTPTRKILITDNKAYGVEIQTEHGPETIKANKEIVLSAGAFHSPHLLLNSGIGDKDEIEQAGVNCIHHLPSVGKGLQDHPATFVAMDTNNASSYGLSLKAIPRDIYNGLEYLFARKGPLGSNLFETNGYVKTLPNLDRPDMQVVFQPARRNPNPFPLPLGHGYAISLVCLYPESRGTVKLAGSDPLTAPLIDPQLGSAERDIECLVRGVKLARKIFSSPSFQPYKAYERVPGLKVEDEQAITDYVRKSLATVHHPGGSCRMGNSENSVVNSELCVHGIDNLRVADASIYPRLVGGNTNASVVAIAEKAADMILNISAPQPLTHLR